MGLVWPSSLDSSDHHDDITCLGSGISIILHFPLLQVGGHIQYILSWWSFQPAMLVYQSELPWGQSIAQMDFLGVI